MICGGGPITFCAVPSLSGEILSRFERKGFKLRALKLYQTPKEVRGIVKYASNPLL